MKNPTCSWNPLDKQYFEQKRPNITLSDKSVIDLTKKYIAAARQLYEAATGTKVVSIEDYDKVIEWLTEQAQNNTVNYTSWSCHTGQISESDIPKVFSQWKVDGNSVSPAVIHSVMQELTSICHIITNYLLTTDLDQLKNNTQDLSVWDSTMKAAYDRVIKQYPNSEISAYALFSYLTPYDIVSVLKTAIENSVEDDAEEFIKDGEQSTFRAIQELVKPHNSSIFGVVLWSLHDQISSATNVRFDKKYLEDIPINTVTDEDENDENSAVEIEESVQEGYLIKKDTTHFKKDLSRTLQLFMSSIPSDQVTALCFEQCYDADEVLNELFRVLKHCNTLEEIEELLSIAKQNNNILEYCYNALFESYPSGSANIATQQELQRAFVNYFGNKQKANLVSLKTVRSRDFVKNIFVTLHKKIRNFLTSSSPKFELEGSGNIVQALSNNNSQYIDFETNPDSGGVTGIHIKSKKDELEFLTNINKLYKSPLTDVQIKRLQANKEAVNSLLLAYYYGGIKGLRAKDNFERIGRVLSAIKNEDTRMIKFGDSSYSTRPMKNKIAVEMDKILFFQHKIQLLLDRLENLSENSDEYNNVKTQIESTVDALKQYLEQTYFTSSIMATKVTEEAASVIFDGTTIELVKRDAKGKPTGKTQICTCPCVWLRSLYNTNTNESAEDPNSVYNLSSFIHNFDTYRYLGTEINFKSTELDNLQENDRWKLYFHTWFLRVKKSGSNAVVEVPAFTAGDTGAFRTFTMPALDSKPNAKLVEKPEMVQEIKSILYAEAVKALKQKTLLEQSKSTGVSTGMLCSNVYKAEGRYIYNSSLLPISDTLFTTIVNNVEKGNLEDFNNLVVNAVSEIQEHCNEEIKKYKKWPAFGDNADKFWYKDINPDDRETYAKNYYYYSMIGYANQYLFLGADPAFCISPMKEETPRKAKQSTSFQKRYKAWYTPGIKCDVSATDYNGNLYSNTGKQKVIYFRDTPTAVTEKRDGKLLAFLKKFNLAGPYEDKKAIQAFDGQGIRTLASTRAVRGMLHTWTVEDEKAYQRLQELRMQAWNRAAVVKYNQVYERLTEDQKVKARLNAKFTAKEIDELNEMPPIAGSIKCHTSGVEQVPIRDQEGNTIDTMRVGLEHKLAEICIIPELFGKESKYKQMIVAMEFNGIDAAMSEECVKVGNFAALDIISYDDDAPKDIVKIITDAATASSKDTPVSPIHTLDYADYTKQIELPFHRVGKQLKGTQMQKHALLGLANDKFIWTDSNGTKHEVTPREKDALYELVEGVTGRNIKAFKIEGNEEIVLTTRPQVLRLYNAIVGSQVASNLKSLEETLSNPTKLRDTIIALRSKDNKSIMESAEQYKIVDNEFAYPMFDPANDYQLQQDLTSLFKKKVLKTYMNGSSYVQISDAGLGYYLGVEMTTIKVNDNGNNETEYEVPKSTECACTWDFSYVDKRGRTVELKYSDYVNDDGTLIKDGNTTKLEKEFPGILEMITYRIPTELDYSITASKAVRFFPRVMGGVISNPYYYMLRAGWDYDADKQYWFRREYKENHNYRKPRIMKLTSAQLIEVFEHLYGLKYDKKGKIIDGNALYKSLKEAKGWYANEKARGEQSNINTQTSTENRKPTVADNLDSNTFVALQNLKSSLSSNLEDSAEIEEDEIQEITNDIGTDNFDIKDYVQNTSRLYHFWELAKYLSEHDMINNKFPEEYKDKTKQEAIKITTDEAIKEEDRYNRSELVVNSDITFDRWQSLPEKDADPWKVNSTVRNNWFFDVFISRLRDFTTILASWTPGGCAPMARIANVNRHLNNLPLEKRKGMTFAEYQQAIEKGEKAENYFSLTSIFTNIVYDVRNKVAKEIIGIMANHSVTSVFREVMGVFELKVPLKIGEESFLSFIDTAHHKGIRTIGQLITASVDAVKTPVLNEFNINMHTANVAATMASLGISDMLINLILNHPAVHELCEFMDNNNYGSLGTAIEDLAKQKGINNLKSAAESTSDFSSKITEEALFNSMVGKDEKGVRKVSDQDILTLMYKLNEIADGLGLFIRKCKFTAANSIDNKLSTMVAHKENIENSKNEIFNKLFKFAFKTATTDSTVSSPVQPNLDMTSDNYAQKYDAIPTGIEQSMYDAVKHFISKANKYLPIISSTLDGSPLRDVYKQFTNKKGEISSEVIQLVNSAYILYKLQSTPGSFLNPETIVDNINDYSAAFYFTDRMGTHLYNFLVSLRDLKAELSKKDGVWVVPNNREDIFIKKYDKLKNNYKLVSSLPGIEKPENEISTELQYLIFNDNFFLEQCEPFSKKESDDYIRRGLSVNNVYNKESEDLFIQSFSRLGNTIGSLGFNLMYYFYYTKGLNSGEFKLSGVNARMSLPVSRGKTYKDELVDLKNDFSLGVSLDSESVQTFTVLLAMNNANNYNISTQIYGVNFLDTNSGEITSDSGFKATITTGGSELKISTTQEYKATSFAKGSAPKFITLHDYRGYDKLFALVDSNDKSNVKYRQIPIRSSYYSTEDVPKITSGYTPAQSLIQKIKNEGKENQDKNGMCQSS